MSSASLPHDHGEEKEIENILVEVNRIDKFQIVADIFKQLGDTTRIRIFWLLCHCEECVLNISAMVGMSSPAVSHHLRPLKNCGLITARREGKEVYYRASDTSQSRLLHRMIEQVMEIACPDSEKPDESPASLEDCGQAQIGTSLQPDQVETIREIHDRLIGNINKRITIEELSKEYFINPTTLKNTFKSLYGTSIAAHIKEHRIEQAKDLLLDSDMNVAEIAQTVGYDSQSKFASAFKKHFGVLPREYRKKHRK